MEGKWVKITLKRDLLSVVLIKADHGCDYIWLPSKYLGITHRGTIIVSDMKLETLTWTRMLSIRFLQTILPKDLNLDSNTIQVNIHINRFDTESALHSHTVNYKASALKRLGLSLVSRHVFETWLGLASKFYSLNALLSHPEQIKHSLTAIIEDGLFFLKAPCEAKPQTMNHPLMVLPFQLQSGPEYLKGM